jgi:hypothetical protein
MDTAISRFGEHRVERIASRFLLPAAKYRMDTL